MAAAVRDGFAPLLHRIPFTSRESLRTIAGVKTGIFFETPLTRGARTLGLESGA